MKREPIKQYYKSDLNDPKTLELYLRFKVWKGIPERIPLSDEERREFESYISGEKTDGIPETGEHKEKKVRKNKSPLHKYRVFMIERLLAEEPENCIEWSREFLGDTWAVSEAKAIANVRYREFGELSQSRPIDTGGHWAKFIKYEAEQISNTGKGENKNEQ